MSYLVLARKYRPNTFDEVVGQEHITGLIKQAITSGRLAHAFLFCGPRGIGKTSCARILAKSLNCANGPTLTPCGACPACREITAGNSFDVLEIDGASNRGIDEIRTLRENVKFLPGSGQYKIYIVDEVHMLTTEAFNALLKTLEEPPGHVKFIFATTDPNKVPGTIISRCQRYDFKRISLKDTAEALAEIGKKEKFQIDQEALYAIAKASQGSFRDALSILDQVSALSGRGITSEDVHTMLGLVEVDLLFDLADALAGQNCVEVLKVFDSIVEKGKDIKQLYKDLLEHFRNLMIIKIGGKTLGRLVDYPVVVKEKYLAQSQLFSLPKILDAIESFIRAQDMARITETLRTPLEIAFARLSCPAGQPAPVGGTEAQAPSPAPVASKAEKAKPVKKTALKPAPTAHEPAKDPGPGSGGDQGEGMIAADAEEEDDPGSAREDAIVAHEPESVALDLDNIRRSWDALTYGVSRKRMSLATFLQDGAPIELKGNKLTVGFSPEHAFHKETLEHQDNKQIVENIFAEKLRAKIVLEYVMIEQLDTNAHIVQDEPMIRNALDTFQGKVVSKWHNE
ncbi:MAG TPA: DNA polymerase III subunit gamma/tau [Candidatus Omnitrophota bacterium]|nr:DNA polymerase III subunit gamma/tau [Candidatus Omnitrophota bacterium]